MFAIVFTLIIICHFDNTIGQLLPLEVFEIHQAQLSISGSTASASHPKIYDTNINDLKYKSLEYTVEHSLTTSIPLSTLVTSTTKKTTTTSTLSTDQLDRRRSRTMSDNLVQDQKRSHEFHQRKETRILYQVGVCNTIIFLFRFFLFFIALKV